VFGYDARCPLGIPASMPTRALRSRPLTTFTPTADEPNWVGRRALPAIARADAFRVSGRLSGRSAVCRDHNVLLGAGSRPLDRRLEVVHRAPAVYPPPPAHRSQPDFATLPATSRIWSCTVRSPAASARRLRLKPATQTLEAPLFTDAGARRAPIARRADAPSSSPAGASWASVETTASQARTKPRGMTRPHRSCYAQA
jgi:hypothetical protein